MHQFTYEINRKNPLGSVLQRIAENDLYKSARDRLLLAFVPDSKKEVISRFSSRCKRMLPEAKLVGMTTLGPMSAETKAQKNIRISILLFSQSTISIHKEDWRGKNLYSEGVLFSEEIRREKDVKGILCLSSGIDISPTQFIEAMRTGNENIPLFGAQAGTAVLAKDESRVFTAESILDNGILLVSFLGKSLEIETHYNLGWNALGSEHVITEADEHGIVSGIDNKPAFQLYERYLNVHLDNYFNENASGFPLLAQNNKMKIARVPISYTQEGFLKFSTEIHCGIKVSLSYSKPEYLLKESLASANTMTNFQPEALLLFACMNRRVFMGNDNADKEFLYYANANKNLCWSYGNGEILRTQEGGGVLNSSIVAVGFREAYKSPASAKVPYRDKELEKQKFQIPLSERLVSFLESTTEDLRNTIQEFESLAEHDQLTKLFNRRKINELLVYELNKRRPTDTLAVLMYDIDFFKKINDTYGHSMGDGVLSKLSNLVNSTIRCGDVQGRWGGEEFMCILSNTSLEGARVLAERIRAASESTDFNPIGQVTISIGVTEARQDDSLESLFLRLDKALYDAKRGGRNRVAVR